MMHPPAALAMRVLQHSIHDHEEKEVHYGERGITTLQLRVVALFVILVAGLCGVVPPICGPWMSSPDSVNARAIRSFSGGTILALALVHIIPEGLEQLGDLMEYPIGGVSVAAGLLILVFGDYLATYFLAGRNMQNSSLQPAAAAEKGQAAVPGQQHPSDHSCCPDVELGSAAVTPAGAVAVASTGVSPFSHSHHHLPACHITTIKHYVACYTMELGCIFHSIIIGVSIGVIVDAPNLLLTMTAVMAFHQALEGLALGSVLAITQLSKMKKASMSVVYAVCMPLGIAIGIAVVNTYNPQSVTALAVQGVLNSVSGGMLLYVSMYHLIGEEFSKHDLLCRPQLAALLMLAVVLGASSMMVIGIWG